MLHVSFWVQFTSLTKIVFLIFIINKSFDFDTWEYILASAE